MSSTADTIDYPSGLAPLLEVRVILEVLSCFAYLPLLKRLAPKGDGHPVITLPPFMSDDKFMNPMRKYLDSLGYESYGWDLGQNTAVDDRKFAKLVETTEKIASDSGRKVSLVGHSLGGIYARLLAHKIPHAVRQVIYLASPFNISDEQSTDLPIRRIYEKLNPTETPNDTMRSAVGTGATPMPSTAIYSEGDGFVPWQFCIDEEDAVTENLRVAGSHTGMPFNLAILYAIADRLAQPEDEWRPFEFHGVLNCVYGASSA